MKADNSSLLRSVPQAGRQQSGPLGQVRLPLVTFLAGCLLGLISSSAADLAEVTLVARNSKSVESQFPRGEPDWDKLGIVELRRTGDTRGELKVYFELTGTAKRYEDYVLLPGEQWFPCACLRPDIDFRENFLLIPAGKDSVLLGLRPRSDYRIEGEETVEVRLLDDASGAASPTYSVGTTRTAAISISDEIFRWDLRIARRNDGALGFVLPEGSLVIGQWDLELSHDLKTWQRVRPFDPGAIAAFAEDTIPTEDSRPRFYRAVLTPH